MPIYEAFSDFATRHDDIQTDNQLILL